MEETWELAVVSENSLEPVSVVNNTELLFFPSSFIPVLEHKMKESKFRAGFGFAGFLFVAPTGKTQPFLKINTKVLEVASLGFLVCSIAAFVSYLRASKLLHDARMFESFKNINPDPDLEFYEFLKDKKNPLSKGMGTYSGGGTTMKYLDIVVILSMLFAGIFLFAGALDNILTSEFVH